MSIIPKTVDNKSNLTINSLNIDSFTTTIFNNKLASKIVYSDISSNITIDSNVYVKLTTNATSIGYGAGGGYFQSANSVSIGYNCGYSNQGRYSVALGNECGKYDQGKNSVSIGESSAQTSQGLASVAIGPFSSQTAQGEGCVSIGRNAGRYNQGSGSVSLGGYAGVNNQHSNSIIINGTGAALDSSIASALFIAPIRDVSTTLITGSTINAYPLYYNYTTKEITTRSTQNSFLYMTNSTTQILSTGLTNMLFPTYNSTYSIGNTGLSYNAGTFSNNTGNTLLLNISCNGAINSLAGGLRAGWVNHSVLGRMGTFYKNPSASDSDAFTFNINCTIVLKTGENFICQIYNSSATTLYIQGGVYGLPTYMTATLLN